MRGRGKRNRFAEEKTERCPELQPLLPSPPFLLPAARRGRRGEREEKSARVRDHEKTNGRPHLASNHLNCCPSTPRMPCGAGRVTLGSAPRRPSKASLQLVKREGLRSKASQRPPLFFEKKHVFTPHQKLHTLATILIKKSTIFISL